MQKTLQLKTKQARLTNQQLVMKILGWTELEYATFIHETGLQYLERYIPTDRTGINALSRSRIFWNWWKNQWAIRDVYYLDIIGDFSTNNWVPLYYQVHDTDVLTNSIHPSAVVLDESYAIMINDFQKAIRHDEINH